MTSYASARIEELFSTYLSQHLLFRCNSQFLHFITSALSLPSLFPSAKTIIKKKTSSKKENGKGKNKNEESKPKVNEILNTA